MFLSYQKCNSIIWAEEEFLLGFLFLKIIEKMRDLFTKKLPVKQTARSQKNIWLVKTINSQSIRVNLEDNSWNILHCSWTATITDAGSWYAKGCLYIDTDVASGTSWLYVNVGTSTSCVFKLITNAA